MKTLALLLFMFLFFAFLLATIEKEEAFRDVRIENGELKFQYKGFNKSIALEDERDLYFFTIDGEAYYLNHYRDECRWRGDSVYICKDFVTFQDQTILVGETILNHIK